jgi:hypothetical protein
MLELIVLDKSLHLFDLELVNAILLLLVLQLFIHGVKFFFALLDFLLPFAYFKSLPFLFLSNLYFQILLFLFKPCKFFFSSCHLCWPYLLWLIWDTLFDFQLLYHRLIFLILFLDLLDFLTLHFPCILFSFLLHLKPFDFFLPYPQFID